MHGGPNDSHDRETSRVTKESQTPPPPAEPTAKPWRRLRYLGLQALSLPLVIAIFLAALWILHRELAGFKTDDVLQEFSNLPLTSSLLAVGVTVVSYLVLSLYDLLALRHVGQQMPYRRVALASFIGYVFSHNIGFAVLTSGSVRFRVYGSAGLSGPDIAVVTLLCVMTYVLGATLLAGAALLLEPVALFSELPIPVSLARTAGVACLAALLSYILWTALRREAISYKGIAFSPPPLSLTGKQLLLAVVDITLAGLALYLLLPESVEISFLAFLGIFVLATLAGMISHVPGGVGVFESAIVLLVPGAPADALLASALAYRVIYFLLPLAFASLLLGGFEAFQQKERLAKVRGLLNPVADRLAPQLLGIAVLLAGTILLLSGASPILDQRIAQIRHFVPLPLFEISHLLASLAGLGLLVLSRGLFHRLDGAYWLTIALLAAASAFSLLKGFDLVPAIAMLVVLLALLLCRRAFYRKAKLLDQPFSLGWITTIGVILAGSLWLGFFSYKHVDYANQLWWQFAFSDDAPRFLRASLLVIAAVVAFAALKLLRPAPAAPGPPGAEELAQAAEIIAAAGTPDSNLARLGDKSLLFSDSGKAFIMYGVAGRSWITLGEPVGPAEEQRELVWAFRDLADRHGGRAAFYQVSEGQLPLFLDQGLSLTKLGEEARVPLTDFGLEGKARRGLRQLHNKIVKDGASFEVLPPEDVDGIMPELKAISDAWLAEKHVREKGFSVGAFSPEYMRQFPLAVVRAEGRIVAFANIWPDAAGEEVSLDLMRHATDAPRSVMEFLFIELMLWGRAQGYAWCSLGMAPLSGLEAHKLAPRWHKVGTFVFRHGEHFYNFEGLRAYKEKFKPVWRPKYLAGPGGIAFAQTLLDVTSLISGGLKGIVSK